jgi:hypothetical protein
MVSKVTFLTNSFDTPSRRSDDPTHDADAEFSHRTADEPNLIQPRLRALSRHYTSLQEHADQVRGLDDLADDSGLTPRHECRREGFTWSSSPATEQQQMPNRNPLPPERSRPDSPPSLQEIIRRATTNGDADSVQKVPNDRLHHVESFESQPSAAYLSESSVGESVDTRRSSIAAFARGIARHVPDMRLFASPERAVPSQEEPPKHDSQEGAFPNKKMGKLPLAPPPAQHPVQYDESSNSSTVIEEPATTPRPNATPQRQPATVGLRERRQVNLDLSMPVTMPDLPSRSRAAANALTSLGPSRPRSPQTPWTRSEQPKWEPPAMAKSTPIVEEDYIHDSIMGSGTQGGLGLLPSSNAFYLSVAESPKFERGPVKVRDRCYISRPQYKSTRSGRSGTSETTLARTPDGITSPSEPRMMQEPHGRKDDELQELSLAHTTTRSRRWRWKASSDETQSLGPQTPQAPKRHFSLNPFRRAEPISKQSGDKDKKSSSSSRPRRGRQAYNDQVRASTSLAQMALPPTFVPPGVKRIPTPPILDAESEVQGKLADFFFDVQNGTFGGSRRTPKATPRGHWDSNAVLMSMTSDIALSEEEEEEEGPEGRPPPPASPAVDFDVNGTPSHLGGPSTGAEYTHMTGLLTPGSWFRIHHGEMLEDQALTTLALKEQDERRKFEWLVPEHLPNSPLCPLHPKYKGPLKGVCYWHGRRNSAGNGRKEDKSGNQTSARQRGEDWADPDEDTPRTGNGSKRWEVERSKEAARMAKKRRLYSLSAS